MKSNDVERIMQAVWTPKPRRPLSRHFTQNVLDQLSGGLPKKSRLERYLYAGLLQKFSKPALAGFIAVTLLVTGGVTYATVSQWPNIKAIFGWQKQLPNGNRVIGVDTENCLLAESLDGKPKEPKKAAEFYEVSKDSTLTNDAIINMIIGVCEENVANNAASAAVHAVAAKGNSDGLLTSPGFVVQEVGPSHIKVLLDKHYEGYVDANKAITYTRLAPELLAFDGLQSTTYADIKAGDTITLVIRRQGTSTRDGYAVGELPPNHPDYDPNLFDDTGLITVEAIVKRAPITGSVSKYHQSLGIDFVHTHPCDNDPSDFCKGYPFNNEFIKQ